MHIGLFHHLRHQEIVASRSPARCCSTASASPPSVTTSGRFFIAIGVTEVIGSTPSTSTSESCSTNARMALISPRRCSTSSSATAIRARCAMRRTVVASTDIEIFSMARGYGAFFDRPYSRPVNRPATAVAGSKLGVFRHPPAQRLELFLGSWRGRAGDAEIRSGPGRRTAGHRPQISRTTPAILSVQARMSIGMTPTTRRSRVILNG